MKWIKIYGTTLLLAFSASLFSQNAYSTTRGVAVMESTWRGTPVKTAGLKVEARVNYDNARVSLRLLSPVLHTGFDSLDHRLDSLQLDDIRFVGKLNIDIVKTQDHPLQTFEVEGRLKGPGWSLPVHGEGSLKHTYYETYACMLSISLHADIGSIDRTGRWAGLGDDLNIRLIQSVLKNE